MGDTDKTSKPTISKIQRFIVGCVMLATPGMWWTIAFSLTGPYQPFYLRVTLFYFIGLVFCLLMLWEAILHTMEKSSAIHGKAILLMLLGWPLTHAGMGVMLIHGVFSPVTVDAEE